MQYGIAPLLSPLFDFNPNQTSMTGLPNSLPTLAGLGVPRPLSAAASYPTVGSPGQYSPHQLGPAPILPGSALRLLNQGRAQGLFTPSTTSLMAGRGPAGYYPGLMPGYTASQPLPNTGSPSVPALKRTRTDSEIEIGKVSTTANGQANIDGVKRSQPGTPRDQAMEEVEFHRPPSALSEKVVDGEEGPSPSKRAKTIPPEGEAHTLSQLQAAFQSLQSRTQSATPQPMSSQTNGLSRFDSNSSLGSAKPANGATPLNRSIRSSSKPSRPPDRYEPLKNPKCTAIMSAVCADEDPTAVVRLIREAYQDQSQDHVLSDTVDWDIVIDDMGHTALHVAASLAHMDIVRALVAVGADIHRGNFQGETPLIRAVLSTHNYDAQSFGKLLEVLHPSIRTIDTARRSVLHHATLTAGVKGRAMYAIYYVDTVLTWIAEKEGADFRPIVDLQDEHGDTALNIAARVGNRRLVRTLLDVGANRLLANKLGLRPGDFGVEPEVTTILSIVIPLVID